MLHLHDDVLMEYGFPLNPLWSDEGGSTLLVGCVDGSELFLLGEVVAANIFFRSRFFGERLDGIWISSIVSCSAQFLSPCFFTEFGMLMFFKVFESL